MSHSGDGAGGGKKVLFDKYELGGLLGCGSSAKVYYAREVRTGQKVAVKCFSKQNVVKYGNVASIMREISIMRRLRHPNIVRLHEVLATRTKIYFVIEFVMGGELFSRLESKGRHSEDDARKYFRQLISAVGFCHSMGVYHRDLKPENILIDEKDNLKVSDFGLSAVHEQMRQDGLFHTLCGTPAYVAPEILIKKGYEGATVDIWSCGVILFTLVAGYLPFNDASLMAMYRKIYRGEYKCPNWASAELKHLISRLLDTNPSTRITVDDIIKDAWFTKGLRPEEVAELSRFHCAREVDCDLLDLVGKKKTMKVEKQRELNAFDLISLSPGFDLSGLFEPPPIRERFVVTDPVEGVLERLEKGWAKAGLEVWRREGKEGLVGMEARSRKPVATMEMSRLHREMAVVEVSVHGREWDKMIRPALNEIVSDPVPAGFRSTCSGS